MYYSIDDIIAKNQNAGYHFFDRESKRFFRSRIGSTVYEGRYFITSEQFVGTNGRGKRLYTVRMAYDSGQIETIGNFNSMTRSGCLSLIRRLPSALPAVLQALYDAWNDEGNKEGKRAEAFKNLDAWKADTRSAESVALSYLLANAKELDLVTLCEPLNRRESFPC